jgi:SAM-dependent methyltransferase
MDKETYRNMQVSEYNKYSTTYDSCKDKCVGNWDVHESYPYDEYLLELYTGKFNKALDFGCGMGRMIKRMLSKFKQVYGADLIAKNLEHANTYLIEYLDRIKLYQTDGLSCSIESNNYDFIYSTICIQHICVYETRINIIKDFYNLLNETGEICLQVGFGWDNGMHWGTNNYTATSTNAGNDFTIPNESHFEKIEKDLLNIGFKSVKFTLKESPHPYIKNYHPNWLFIHAKK